MRIDFHVHMGVYAFHNPWVTEWMKETHPEGYEEYIRKYDDPGAFEELLAAEGVDYACVLAELSPSTTGLCTNEQVRDFCRGRRRLIPFCDISPNLFTDLGGELRRKVEDEGFRGVKLYPSYQQYYPNEQRMYPLYQAAQDLGIPVLIHIGSSVFRGTRMKYCDPLHLDDVAVDFPELDRLTEKVIFGSDWPGMPWIRRNMEAIGKLPLPAEGVERILGGNAARLLRI